MNVVNEMHNTIAVPNSSRGRERLARILEAATELFLRDGYGATSIDSILERSGGSKATLYSYFPAKDDLFRAVVDEVVSNASQPQLDTSRDIRTVLTEFAVQRLETVFSERHRALLRLIIAERERFPDLAKMYYERWPRLARNLLHDYFGALKRQNLLEIDTADEAAEFFIGMVLHQWYIEILLLGAEVPSSDAIRRRAERCVAYFLFAFERKRSAAPA
ncbi:MAG TPA: TetR/AcrR family transcriptional regulator [Gammaproteobacteria bacterium]|nr:TetR/AcrR family transcriptional regulator [Gammaproteobacteria bacterium]